MEVFALLVLSVFIYAIFRQWMHYRRRTLIHVERLAAIEKGLPVPPDEVERPRGDGWKVQRILLLAGLVWMSLGVTYLVTMAVFIANPTPKMTEDIPQGVQWIGLAPILIGLSHLIVFWLGKKREEASPRPGASIEPRRTLMQPMEPMERRETV